MVAVKIILPLPSQTGPREFILNIVNSANGHLESLNGVTFDYTAETILQTERSEVYKGTLKRKNYAYESKVACKIAEGANIQRLQQEADLYTTVLREVSDTVVPQYICYCTGKSPYTNQPIACLMTRYRGRPLPGIHWSKVDPEIRFRAFLSLMKLHQLGIRHNDFVPRNIVMDDAGCVVVVDFNEATSGHICNAAHKRFHIYDPKPTENELDCEEIYKTSINMDIWTPVRCIFKGISVVMSKSTTPDDLVKLVLDRWPDYDEDDAELEAVEFLNNYTDRYIARRRVAREKWAAVQLQAAVTPGSLLQPTPTVQH